MRIVTYQPVYQAAVINLILSIQQQEFKSAITLEDQPDLLEIPTVYQQENGNFWIALDVALDDGLGIETVIGTIAAIDIGNDQLVLRKMFVSASARRQGIGSQLLSTLLEWAIARHIQEIYLGTIEAFTAAHQFYEKHGFCRIEAIELPKTFLRMKGDTLFFRWKNVN
jgi:GNAT superfamily N-acetyltransferase